VGFDVAEALYVNQTPPALALLERKLADPQQPESESLAWMRQLLLPRRNDEPLLASCERLLKGPLPEKLKGLLVAALFDYRADWYVGDDPPRPPAREAASGRARELMRQIGNDALKKSWLDSEEKAVVRKVLAEIRG
jgi:hypothetical protein